MLIKIFDLFIFYIRYIYRNTITEGEIRNCIDEYLNSLINAISEKEFIVDYHQFYPIDVDLKIVTKFCPEVYPFLKELQYYTVTQKRNIFTF